MCSRKPAWRNPATPAAAAAVKRRQQLSFSPFGLRRAKAIQGFGGRARALHVGLSYEEALHFGRACSSSRRRTFVSSCNVGEIDRGEFDSLQPASPWLALPTPTPVRLCREPQGALRVAAARKGEREKRTKPRWDKEGRENTRPECTWLPTVKGFFFSKSISHK